MSDTLDYDKMVFLDADDLAEVGIFNNYVSLLPELRQYALQPAQVEELIDQDVGRYVVKCGSREFVIHAPDLDDKGCASWGRATVAFFTIINEQLAHSQYRFDAINGSNDLGGMFLTPAQAEAAQKALPNKRNWH